MLRLGSEFQQNSIARFGLYVSLNADVKGTHMSRFVEVIENMNGQWDLQNLKPALELLLKKLPSQCAYIDLECPIFLTKSAPVSGKSGPMKYMVRVDSHLSQGQFRQTHTLKVWVTTLCPCSKAISNFSAHNQRGEVTLTFHSSQSVDIPNLISRIESASSSQLYSLLKRVDEKAVTELAYQNPVFVEDLVRNIADNLKILPELTWFQVEAENFESIHLHNAYAMLSSLDLDA